jgi:hypothetical protein
MVTFTQMRLFPFPQTTMSGIVCCHNSTSVILWLHAFPPMSIFTFARNHKSGKVITRESANVGRCLW